jgi:hypothetical protein
MYSCLVRLAPSRVSHTNSWVAFVWGDGPRLPGPLARPPCQALGAAAFIVIWLVLEGFWAKI